MQSVRRVGIRSGESSPKATVARLAGCGALQEALAPEV